MTRHPITSANLGRGRVSFRPTGLVLIALTLAAAAHADELVLRNGDHIEARILEQSRDRVTIERHFRSGILYRQTLPRGDIVRIIEKPFNPPKPAAKEATVEPQIELGAPAPPPGQEDLLDNAIDRYRQGEFSVAGILLTRLINNADTARLPELSDRCRAAAGLPLDAFTAEVRMRVALDRPEGLARITQVTRYERPALIARLDEALQAALLVPIAAGSPHQPRRLIVGNLPTPADAASTRPAADAPADASRALAAQGADTATSEAGWTLASLLENAESFDGGRSDAEALERQLRLGLALLNERMRLDLDLRRNRDLKDELVTRRVALIELLEQVSDWAGDGLTPREATALAAERRYLRMVNESRLQWAEQVRRESVRKARIAAGLPPEAVEKEPRPPQLPPFGPAIDVPTTVRQYEGNLDFTGGAFPPKGGAPLPPLSASASLGDPPTPAGPAQAARDAPSGGELVPTTPYRAATRTGPLPSFSTGRRDRAFAPPPTFDPDARTGRPPPLPDFTPAEGAEGTREIPTEQDTSVPPAESREPAAEEPGEDQAPPPLPEVAPVESEASSDG